MVMGRVAGSPVPGAQFTFPCVAVADVICSSERLGTESVSMLSVSRRLFVVPAAQSLPHHEAFESVMLLAHAPLRVGHVTVHVQPPTMVVASVPPLWQNGFPAAAVMVNVAGLDPTMPDVVGVRGTVMEPKFCPATKGLGVVVTVPMFNDPEPEKG